VRDQERETLGEMLGVVTLAEMPRVGGNGRPLCAGSTKVQE
jgi:hypothetical protein